MANTRKTRRTKLDERQFMEMARTLAAREVPILRRVVEDAAQALFSCNYEDFFSNAEQALAMRPRPEVAFLVEHALACFPRRNAAA